VQYSCKAGPSIANHESRKTFLENFKPTMTAKILLLILGLLVAAIFSAPTPPVGSLSLSQDTSISSLLLLARGSPLSTSSPPLSSRDQVTQTLSTKHINAREVQRRNWSKLQLGVFLGWMIPAGVGVLCVIIAIFFWDRIKAAWRRRFGKKEGTADALVVES